MRKPTRAALGPVAWAAALAGWVGVALADVWDWDDNHPGVRTELVHGAEQLHTLGPGSVQDPGARDVDHFTIGQAPLSSYEILVDGISNQLVAGTNDLVVERSTTSDTTVIQTAVPAFTAIGGAKSLRWQNSTTSPLSDAVIKVRSTAACPLCSSGRSAYIIRTYETTYRASRFNNTGTQTTVLLVQNTSDDTINGGVHFWNAGGALAGSQVFVMGPRQLLVVNTASLPFAVGVGGSITVSHDGRYGDLTGKAVALEPATGFTFDTLLEPRPR